METKFKFAIQVPHHVTQGIMELPCVESCRKGGNGGIYYVLYWICMHDNTKWQYAHPTEWLCQDEENKWHVLTNEEYSKL